MANLYSDGALDIDIKTILDANGSNPKQPSWYGYLHTELIDLPIPLLESVEILRDYNANIGDYNLVSFKIGMGDYIKDILPYRDNLQMTLVKKNNVDQFSLRYKCVLVNNNNYVAGGHYDKMSKEELNKQQMINMEVQCLDRRIEVLRTIANDGIFKNTPIKDVFTYVIQDSITNVKIGSERITFDFNAVEPNNTRVYDHIEVPTGIKVLDLATYLHSTNYGIYNGGIGTYFQLYGVKKVPTLFIYPLYSNALFNTVDKKLVIYKSSTTKYDYLENTYFVDGDLVKIIATSKTKSVNMGNNALMDKGVSVIQADPNTMIERNAIVKNGSISVSKDATMQGQAVTTPKDGNYNQVYAGVTDNLYKQRSAVYKNSMTTFQVQWNHPDTDLIYPGMAVMYVFNDSEKGIRKMTGIVQSTYSKYVKGTNETACLLNIVVSEVSK